MSFAVVRSPGRHGATTPIANVYYKCDDCGDVSHSQASLNLHRSVCHNPEGSKRPSTDDQEEAEKNSEVVDKTEQIAESCECPKCGEQLLLLRERTYNCALCDFQDTDQSKFFVHLKQHYEQNSTYNLEAGSVIFEQVIDSTEDLDALKVSEVVEERIERSDSEEVEPDDGEEVDDRKDPLYAPDDDDLDDDDVESVETEECKLEKGNVELSWTQPLKKVGADKNLMKAPVAKPKDSSNSKYKFGISWNSSGDGASKKITFVKTSQLVSSVDETKPLLKSASTTKQLSFVKSPTAGGRPATVWKESASGKETPKKHTSPGGMRWVRLEDIKLESPSESFPRPLPPDFPKYSSILKKPTPSNRSSPVKRSNTTKEPIPVKVEKESNQNSEAEPKKKTKKPTEKKPPRERQLPVCGVCKRIFSTAQSLKVHMRIHTGEKNFTCDQCGKAFTQWSTCSQHIEALHSGIKRHTCEFCGKSFARSSSLKVHRRIHTGEKVYYCNVCGKGFRCKSYMDRHRTFHTGEKRYRCEFCSKNFRTSTDMKRHRNAIHFGLGNVSLTVAKELLVNRMDIMRTPQRQATVQRLPEQFAESVDTSDSEEVIRATSIITDSTYEL